MIKVIVYILESTSYFLAGTFLLQLLFDPILLDTLSPKDRIAIYWTGNGFLIIGFILAVLSLPYISKKVKSIHFHIINAAILPLFLVTLGAIAVTGLKINLFLTVIVFLIISISFVYYSFKVTEPQLKTNIRSWVGIGKIILSAGIPLLWVRFIGWKLEVVLPQENYILIIGLIFFLLGVLLLIISFIIKNKRTSSEEQIANSQASPSGSSNILIDEPITTAEQDRLNRKLFAGHFAETLIQHTRPSCLISALYGPWGSGKSSLLNLIENYIQEKSIPGDQIVIRFNPWNISSLDQLLAMFFHELKVAVQGKKHDNRITDTTVKLIDVFGGILTVGQLSPIGNQYFSIGAEVTKKIGGTIKDTQTKSLDEIKNELNTNLKKIIKRIFIIIDDIDRLDADAIKLLFRMIRLNADFENVTYLLAFDHAIVEDILNDEQPKHGKEYLEKIIQLPIHIPNIDEATLISILVEELDAFIRKHGEEKFDQHLWRILISQGRFFKLFRTIRDVVRYVNGLWLNYAIIKDEVNMVDFMALEVIRVFAPNSYSLIRRNKSIFIRLNTRGSLEQDEQIDVTKQILEQIFTSNEEELNKPIIKEKRSEIIKDVCRVMFPQLDRIYSNMTYSAQSEMAWRQQKRICSEDVFDKYFLLGVPKGEISDEEMRATLARNENHLSFVEAIKEIFDNNLGKRFFELFEDYLSIIPEDKTEEAIVALFELEAQIVSVPREMLGIDTELQSARIIHLLLLKIRDKESRKKVLINAIERSTKIFQPVHFISLISPEGDAESLRNRSLVELELSEEDLAELQQLCIEKIKEQAESGELSKSPHLGMLLFRWIHWGDETEVKAWVEGLVATDRGLLDLLVGFSTEVISSDRGRFKNINRQNIETFVDIKQIEEKVYKIIEDKIELSELERECVDAFLKNEEP